MLINVLVQTHKTKVHLRNRLLIQSKNYTAYRILLLFRGEKFHGLTSFLSFPEILSRLPVTLPVLGTLDDNIHGKTFAVAKRSAKTAKLFHHETKAIYGMYKFSTDIIFVDDQNPAVYF